MVDIDNDGNLDIYVVTYRAYHAGRQAGAGQINARQDGNDWTMKDEVKVYYKKSKVKLKGGKMTYKALVYGRHDYLLRNDGKMDTSHKDVRIMITDVQVIGSAPGNKHELVDSTGVRWEMALNRENNRTSYEESFTTPIVLPVGSKLEWRYPL